ncbi:hypothetical protein ACFLS9_05455 [Bacteroidota bacterium]
MKYVKTISLVIILIINSTSFSQTEFDFTGYIIDLPVYQKNNKELSELFAIEDYAIININRIRLKPTIYLPANTRINIEYEISSIYFSSESSFAFGFGKKTNRQLFDLSWNIVNENNFSLNHFIDRIYFRKGFDFGNITIGRQRISWGTGRIWNPTDLFNPINPANFAKIEKDGADAVSIKASLASFTDVQIVFNPKEKFKHSNYGFRFRSNYSEYDYSIIGGYFDKRYVIGADFAGNLLTAGIRGEGIVSINKNNGGSNFVKYIFGIDYQFNAEIYAVLEYHFNGEGTKNKLEYEFNRLINGEILNLNKDYLYTGMTYQFNPLLYLMISEFSNLNDGSGFISILGNYSVTADFYLSLGFQYSFGSNLSEYWYYPNSIYLQGEYYF